MQVIDRLLRMPLKLGGAELRFPPTDDAQRNLDRSRGFPPPSWKVGGVELVEACHPLHDEQFNAAIASSMWKSLFLTTEQVSSHSPASN